MPTMELAIDASRAQIGANQFRAATNRARDSTGKFVRSAKQLDNRMNSLGATAKSVALSMGAMAGALGAGLGLRETISTISNFEETMATLSGVSRATAEEMQRFNDVAREMGATTRFSAQEAGDGLLFLSRAGFRANESVEALPATLDLATAAAMDLGEAADIASNVVSQFNLEAGETNRVADTLVNVSNSANTNVQQLAEAMKMAGPVAGALGRSVEETAAAIGVMGDSGIQASLAGTMLRGTFAGLMDVTGDGKRALADLGLTMEQVNPETHSLVDVFRELSEAGMTAEHALALFGRRQQAGALVMAQSVDKMQELTDSTMAADGAARDMAAKMEDTLAQSFRNLSAAVSELMLTIGEAGLGGALRTTVDTLTDTVRLLAGMEDHVDDNATAAHSLAGALEAVTVAGGALIALKLPGFFLTAATALRTLTAAALSNPFTALAAAASITVGTLYALRDASLEFVGIDNTVSGVFSDLIDWTREWGSELIDFLAPTFSAVAGAATAGFNMIKDMVTDTYGALIDAGQHWAMATNAVFNLIGFDDILGRFGDLQTGIVSGLVFLEYMFKNWEDFLGLWVGSFMLKVSQVGDAFDAVFVRGIPRVLVFLRDNFLTIFEDMTSAMDHAIAGVGDKARDMRQIIVDVLTLQRTPAEAFQDAMDTMLSNPLEGWDGPQFMKNLEDDIVDINNAFAIKPSMDTQLLEEQITQMERDLAMGFSDFYQRRMDEIFGEVEESGRELNKSLQFLLLGPLSDAFRDINFPTPDLPGGGSAGGGGDGSGNLPWGDSGGGDAPELSERFVGLASAHRATETAQLLNVNQRMADHAQQQTSKMTQMINLMQEQLGEMRRAARTDNLWDHLQPNLTLGGRR